MQFVPKKHQEIAAKFLREHDRCCLFLDMGLGKTVVTLSWIKDLRDARVIRRALVVAPKRVAESTWSGECEKWDHLQDLTVSIVMGTVRQRERALETPADIYVINRDNLKWLVDGTVGAGKKWPFDLVVLDELTSFKNTGSKRWRSARRVMHLSDYLVCLTGTPAPNGYEELWGQMYLVDYGESLGKSHGGFDNEYFRPGRTNGHVVFDWILKPGAKERIDAALKPKCLSMSKEDWLELPPLMTNIISVRMSKEERKLYDDLYKSKVLPLLDGKLAELEESDSAVVGSTAAVLSNKLLQMANGAVYDDNGGVFQVHDQKIDALMELADSNGDNLLVFYEYQHDQARILKWFPDARVLKDAKDIDDWNAGKIKMLLCHPQSAAFGLNLQQGGHTMVWFGLPWSLELHTQAIARLHRQGQEHPVICHYIICEKTLDEKVYAVLQQKEAVQKSLLDALKDYVTEE